MPDIAPDTAPQSQDPPKAAKTDAEILADARERLKRCIDDNSDERTKQKDDLVFSMLQQWPDDIRSQRENDPNGPRPCLTIDQINQYIGQVVNDLRQNQPAVKIRPNDDKADVETAKVFQGVIRHIEDKSVAQVPYMTAADSAVRVGEGYFRIVTEYESETSFNQVIRIKEIPDMFAVYLGPHVSPTGSDAEYGFVLVDMPETVFKRTWPKAKWQSVNFDELESYGGNWQTAGAERRIRVAEYFYFDYSDPFTILFLDDGTVVKKSEYTGDKDRIQDERQTRTRSTKWCKLTGVEVLEKRDWAGKYIPIVKITGKQSWIDGKRAIWGLVRPAKDALRMFNYVVSTIVEKFALAPKAPFVGAKGQFEGVEEVWKNLNRVNYAYAEYNPLTIDGHPVPPPQRQQPAPMEAALYQFLETCKEGVQSSLAMFKASLGKEQANQSGKAILALTRESDTGTYHFAGNTALAIQHCGTILVDLTPKIYDTKRVLKITGEDGKVATVEIDPEQQQAHQDVRTAEGVKSIYNLGVGDYDVTSTVGPSYNTMRMEAATLFTDLANSSKDPMSAAVMRYLAVKYSDMPHADVAAEMLEKLLPPGVAPKKDGQPQIPPEVAQKMQMMEQAGNELLQENAELKSGAQEAQAKIAAQHDAKMKEIELKGVEAAAEDALARNKAKRELDLKEWVAKEEIRIAEEAERKKAELEEKKVANAHEAAMKKASMMPAATA